MWIWTVRATVVARIPQKAIGDVNNLRRAYNVPSFAQAEALYGDDSLGRRIGAF
jgi:hypothetical protein